MAPHARHPAHVHDLGRDRRDDVRLDPARYHRGGFGATITFAGNLAGRTQTLPLAVYQTRQTDPGAAILISLILVALSLIVLIAMRDRIFAR